MKSLTHTGVNFLLEDFQFCQEEVYQYAWVPFFNGMRLGTLSMITTRY